ncbi:MAG TPA: SRPBCC family protein [Chitinophagaceae bacterium]|nr:SRPBCC family protein [Chitinophagaceae bacterium]
MKTNYYIFIDKFVASCDIETAYHYIRQIEEYPRWWGKVYKKIIKLKEAPPDVAGAKYRITVGGFLPYSLTIDNEVTHIYRPNLICFDAEGELQGKGVWSFREVDEGTEVTFDWRVAANKKVIRFFSFLLKPLFKANHHYCMVKAREGMEKDLSKKNQLSSSI